MAACRRAWHGMRHAQVLVRTTATGLMHKINGLGHAGGETGVVSSSCSSSYSYSSISFWHEERGEERWWINSSRDAGWRNLAWRHVHATAREEQEIEKDEGFRGGGMSRLDGAKVEREGVAARVANEEARNLVQQVHLTSLKKKLRDDPRDTICYEELLHICRTVGMASDDEEAKLMAHVFNQAGVVLMFRGKIHLHPEKIAEIVANVLPLSLLGEDDQRRMELMALLKQKEEIDRKAHKQMRFVLWTGLCGLTLQIMVFFRLTFWELSWDVMEPIAFFATAGGLVCGYAYFMFTSRDPTYQDLMQRIYHARQRKLFRKKNFDFKRFKELQMQCQTGWKPLTKKILEDAE